jgi:hypothetical protein
VDDQRAEEDEDDAAEHRHGDEEQDRELHGRAPELVQDLVRPVRRRRRRQPQQHLSPLSLRLPFFFSSIQSFQQISHLPCFAASASPSSASSSASSSSSSSASAAALSAALPAASAFLD